MPDRSGSGTASVHGAGVQIVIEQHPGATTIQAAAPSVGVLIDVEIPLPQGHEALGPLGTAPATASAGSPAGPAPTTGEWIGLDGLTGWAEEVHSAWTAKDPIQ
jgi:hypothetical protein